MRCTEALCEPGKVHLLVILQRLQVRTGCDHVECVLLMNSTPAPKSCNHLTHKPFFLELFAQLDDSFGGIQSHTPQLVQLGCTTHDIWKIFAAMHARVALAIKHCFFFCFLCFPPRILIYIYILFELTF